VLNRAGGGSDVLWQPGKSGEMDKRGRGK